MDESQEIIDTSAFEEFHEESESQQITDTTSESVVTGDEEFQKNIDTYEESIELASEFSETLSVDQDLQVTLIEYYDSKLDAAKTCISAGFILIGVIIGLLTISLVLKKR